MNKIFSIFLVLSIGCHIHIPGGTPKLNIIEQALQKKDTGELRDLRRRAVIAHLGLRVEDVIKTDWEPVERLIERSTPENLENRLRILAEDFEGQLDHHYKYKGAIIAAFNVLEEEEQQEK